MTDVMWLVRRLRAMSIPEVVWRTGQKITQKKEAVYFKPDKTEVVGKVFNPKLTDLRIDAEKMHLNLKNTTFSMSTVIPLLGGYDYSFYKQKWNAGFQTAQVWPERFSYELEYKQRDDIGDARTNWELNRHFQFALLAKAYRVSENKKYLDELETLFYDWNKKNPFLWGISWTSVMEIAIRCSNWCFTYCFLDGMKDAAGLQGKIRTGIINMADYIAKHYSRYSSANNHLIVEAYAIGQTGILCGYFPWIKLASEILTKELPLQNYPDGVNRELSLHYQAFYMEAMGLTMRLFHKNHIAYPEIWNTMLDKMCRYVADCTGDYGEVVEFGDNDEGKILDLQGGLDYYPYVLGLFSYILPARYANEKDIRCENLKWLFDSDETEEACRKAVYHPPLSACYREGGNTILRSEDRKILIGIDHAELGFGSIAAHGHADALSFQMFVEGQPVFADPGTYIYHCDIKSRNAFRKTENHNTVCIDGRDQSEMLGPFLWGRRAECRLTDFEENSQIILKAEHNGYKPVVHRREFCFNKKDRLVISDFVEGEQKKEADFVFAPGLKVDILEKQVIVQGNTYIIKIDFKCGGYMNLYKENKMYSSQYGIKRETQGVRVDFGGNYLVSCIQVQKIT